jgi:hypothetical protein
LPFVRVQVFSRSPVRPWMKIMLDELVLVEASGWEAGEENLLDDRLRRIVDDFEVVSAHLGDEVFGGVPG